MRERYYHGPWSRLVRFLGIGSLMWDHDKAICLLGVGMITGIGSEFHGWR